MTDLTLREELRKKLRSLNKGLREVGMEPLFGNKTAKAMDVPHLQAAVDISARELVKVRGLLQEAGEEL